MVMQETAQAIRRDIDREVARLRLVQEARRLRSEEATPTAPKARRVWRWKVERGAEPSFEALRTWLLTPYVKSASK
jgi:hypothetical protein